MYLLKPILIIFIFTSLFVKNICENNYRIHELDKIISLKCGKDTIISFNNDTLLLIRLNNNSSYIDVKQKIKDKLIYHRFYGINKILKTDSIFSMNPYNLKWDAKVTHYFDVYIIEKSDSISKRDL